MLKRSSIRFCYLVLRASLSTGLSGLPESIAHHPEIMDLELEAVTD